MSTPPPAPYGDFVLPFDIAKAGVRGRLVRLDASSARALSSHQLPEAAARVAGETLALAAMLGTALKLDGRLTVQTKSDGPLDLVAADYYGSEDVQAKDDAAASRRGVRGYARVDEKRASQARDFAGLIGKGSMAITIEPQRGGNTYQGIVALDGGGIAASAENYFAQSEQLPTAIRLAAGPLFVAGEKAPRWRAGGLMLQMTPEVAKPGAAPEDRISSDDWTRLSLLLKTVDDLELLDTALAPETVLWRLFNEDEVRVQPPLPIAFRCDCDAARIVQILKGYGETERATLADPDGVIRATCEFCGTVHQVTPGDLI